MQREIKFRAWDIERKSFFYPKLWDSTMPSNWDQWYVLQQYTGLEDIKGNDIYEGDLLLFNDGKVYPVSFESGSFIIDNEPLCFDLQAEERQPMKVYPKNFATVIGNIYKHPNLLNQ